MVRHSEAETQMAQHLVPDKEGGLVGVALGRIDMLGFADGCVLGSIDSLGGSDGSGVFVGEAEGDEEGERVGSLEGEDWETQKENQRKFHSN